MIYTYRDRQYQIEIEKLYIEITTLCNAQCPYCYNSSGRTKEYMDTGSLFSFLEKALEQDIKRIHLSGGEPLLHPDYRLFVDFINSMGGKVLTVSNTTLITKEFLDSYMKDNVLQITLDSMEKEEHDRTRGAGNYEKVMEIIEYCRNINAAENIYLRHNIIRRNREDMREFIEFAIKNGIKRVALSVLRNMGRAHENAALLYDYKNNTQELLKLNDEMAGLRQEFGKDLDIVSNMFENQSGCPFNRPQDFRLSPRIDCYGNLYICESFDGRDNIVGNVFEQPMEKIFESGRFEEYVTILFERQGKNQECRKCLLNQSCTGGCPADQYMEAGNYYSCTSQCAIIKENFKNSLLRGGIL